MQTRDQKYGAAVFHQIRDKVESRDKAYRKAYGSMAHKLPFLIRSAGLAQALAFVEARGLPPHRELLDHLAEVVIDQNTNGGQLAQKSRDIEELSEYIYLTHEAMAALIWYKRFAQSVLDIDPSEAVDEEVEPQE
jgi:CRISPR-associated protein Cmr5